ncbi:MAG: hypothetical protein DMG90_09505 [Acidobacteria bacterium]|nr:MAG: hypothetical protein DMG90_09505 [Acidobacteriota bacterium]
MVVPTRNKWHHHQAHNIVHEKSREKTRSENHRRQQMRRLDAAQHQLRAPFEEAHQVVQRNAARNHVPARFTGRELHLVIARGCFHSLSLDQRQLMIGFRLGKSTLLGCIAITFQSFTRQCPDFSN